MNLTRDEKLKFLKRILDWSRRKSNGCLVCYNGLNEDGYSRPTLNGERIYSIRFIMHIMTEFELDSPLNILHNDEICSSRACIEFDHLRIGTQAENIRDMNGQERFIGLKKSHCVRGHRRISENLFANGNCKLCDKLRRR